MITGASFATLNNSLVFCSFDEFIVVGNIVNASQIACVAPPNIIPGEKKLRISLNSIDYFPKDSGVIFTYSSVATIYSISPWHGPRSGGTVISVYGKSFPVNSNIQILFENMLVDAVRVNSSHLLFTTPNALDLDLDSNELKLSLSIGNNIIKTNFIFRFDNSYSVVSISPVSITSSPPPGFTISLHGSGFIKYPELVCRIGDILSDAVWVSESHIRCKVPPLMTPGVRYVSLSMNGFDFIEAGYVITVSDIILYEISPQQGSQKGYTPIQIKLSGLDPKDTYYCVINNLYTIASVDNTGTEIKCLSPPSDNLGFVSVVLASEERESINTLLFEYIPTISLAYIEPALGFTGGSTEISLHVDSPRLDSFKFQNIYCLFDDQRVLAKSINFLENIILCDSPSHSVGYAVIYLSFNGFDIEETDQKFRYVDLIHDSNIEPSVISSSTDVVVNITGNKYEEDVDYFCRYGSLVSSASRISNTMIRCKVNFPPGVGMVSLSVNKKDWIGQMTVQSRVLLKVLSVSHSFVGWNTHAKVSLLGYGFTLIPNQKYIRLKSNLSGFERIVKVESNFTDTEISFVMPNWLDRFDDVFINLEFNQFVSDKFLIKIHPSIIINKINPVVGIFEGKTFLTMELNYNLPSDMNYSVVFTYGKQSYESTVTIVNSLVYLLTPPLDAVVDQCNSNSTYSIEVALRSSSEYTTPFVYFHYLPSIEIQYMEPSELPESGGLIFIYVKNIPMGYPFLCRFQDTLVGASKVSQDFIACVAPPANSIGNVTVYISPNNGTDWIVSNHPLKYFPNPKSFMVYPTSGTIHGGTNLSVSGLNIESIHDSNVLCKFGILEVNAVYNSDTKILSCFTPKSIRPDLVSVKLSIRHPQGQLIDTIPTGFDFEYYGENKT